MKKNVIVLMMIAVLLCGIALAEYHANIGTVIEVHGDITLIEDYRGELWEVYADGLSIGDNVLMVIDDMGTEDIIDDEIINLDLMED